MYAALGISGFSHVTQVAGSWTKTLLMHSYRAVVLG
jgi:hypothetical protein